MNGEREHDDVVVIHDDLQIRIAGLDDRVGRLERHLDDVDDELSRRGVPRPGEPLSWRRLPEFNLCPPVMQLTIDDEIALLQTTIQTRLERER